ncbi:MAG: DUF748 domain-containing protein [Candidatus Binatia bacterium]
MPWKTDELRRRATELARKPRTRKMAVWLGAIIIAIGILGALAAPPLLRYLLANQLTKALHREVSIQQIRINPYALSATIRGFLMKERQSDATALSFEELHVNLESLSFFQRGIVLKELQLRKPYVNLIRNENRTYNFQDLIDELTSGPPGPRPRFSLNNIEIIDGTIDFDDRPENTKHSVSSIKIGFPFVSSLPYHADLRVQPAISAVVNGAPLEIGGETKPFKDSLETVLHFDLNSVNIPKYLEYSPVELNFKFPSGQLSGELAATFRTVKDKPPVLSISGNLAVTELVLQEKDGAPLMKLPQLDVSIDAFDVFTNKAIVKSVKAQGLELHLARGRDGNLNVASLIRSSAKPGNNTPNKEPRPFDYRLDEISIESGKLHFIDQSPQRPYKTRLDDLRLEVRGLTNEAGKKANVELSFESDAKARFKHDGRLQLTPLLAEGTVTIEGLKPGAFQPYYQTAIAAEIKEGFLDLSTQYTFESKSDQTDIKLAELNAMVRKVRLELPGHPEPLWRIASLAVKNTTVDVAKKSIVIGALEGRDGSGYLQREPDGGLSYARFVKARPDEPASKTADKKDDDAWNVQARRIVFDRFKINFDDRAAAAPAKINLSDVSVRGENFSTARNQRGKVIIRGKINNNGMLRLAGSAGANPANANFIVEGQEIELLPFQTYLTERLNLSLTSGRVGTKGKLNFDASGNGPAKLTYSGNAQIMDFAAIEKNGAQDLLKWKSLNLDGIQFALDPMQLRIDDINLADFYSRLIIGADGKLNLQNLTANADEKKETPVKTDQAEPSVQAAAPAQTGDKRVTIGKVHLQRGNVNFSDFFVKPNYSANLTDVQGTISELKPETPGDLDVVAKLDGAAPVEIRGKINPLSKELSLDIVADAKEIELNTLSPYSSKYVGYGIEKGKLSFNVKYKVENRKLNAENKIVLNQLTFGEKVESPEATKLPVLLAVALLKDRNGVIDVDLPISGSLDDPQFSIGGIVLRIIINIITKAVTAPFALLGAAFGGGGQELSYVEFDYGRTNLTQAAEARIKTLAAAMNNRPALKLEIMGRVDAVNDLDGLKRAAIERKLKAQKMRELARQGTAPKSVDEVQIDKAEYERYLKAAYAAETFPKPRNFIGLAKDLPAAEMESLIIKHTQVTDDDLRELGNRRAQAVRDRLLATGQVGFDRLFIVAPKAVTAADEEKTKAKTSRVEFSLR